MVDAGPRKVVLMKEAAAWRAAAGEVPGGPSRRGYSETVLICQRVSGSAVTSESRARRNRRRDIMETKRFIYYQERELFVGWLEEYPDYRTQGETMDELRKNLQELHGELTSGQIPCVHKVGELSVARSASTSSEPVDQGPSAGTPAQRDRRRAGEAYSQDAAIGRVAPVGGC